jgi:CRP/FNR family transcriptional regulator, cyclic AMP receptor protein
MPAAQDNMFTFSIQKVRIMMFRLISSNGVSPSNLAASKQLAPVFTSAQIEHGVWLLSGDRARLHLSEPDARSVLRYMELRVCQRGELLMHERNTGARSQEMMLVLSGCATVERQVAGRFAPAIVAQIQEGDFLGEMSLLEDATNSAKCRAISDLEVAILSSSQLLKLVNDHPSVGVKLLLAVAQRMAERLRLGAQKLFLYEQMLVAADAREQPGAVAAQA